MDLSLDFFLRLGAGHFETVYHISPEANIQRFRGTYSPKFGERGIFVGPKMAVFRSWASYVAGKKGEGQRYKNLTLYAR